MNRQARAESIGFAGLGVMGAPMAENILKKGFALVVFDRNPEKVARLVALGASAASNARELAQRCATLVSMVNTTEQAEEVILGTAGFISAVQSGDVVLSMSTIAPDSVRNMHGRLSALGADIIDAAVTGMEAGARAGTLRAYAGGSAETLERVRPLLHAMTSEVHHLGALGNGIAMKLVINMLFQLNRVVIAEALAFGAKAGLEPQLMFDLVSSTASNSPAFQMCGQRMVDREFSAGIELEIAHKDIDLQMRLARSLRMPLFMANAAHSVYEMARAAGLQRADGAAVVQVYERITGVPAGRPTDSTQE